MGGRPSQHAQPLQQQQRPDSLSVIIPALNEEQNIASAIESVRRDPGFAACGGEIIVVDGRSQDGTARAARRLGVKVLRSQRGRGLQMNAGAQQAAGDVLLFLHADSQLPPGWLGLLQQARSRRAAWGCFESIRLDALGPLPRAAVRQAVALRTRLYALPYGDQALFVDAALFRRAGGFQPFPLMEDVDLVRRLRSAAGRPTVLPRPVATSARRWQRRGFLQTTLQNWRLLAAFWRGADPHALAAQYYGPPGGAGGGRRTR